MSINEKIENEVIISNIQVQENKEESEDNKIMIEQYLNQNRQGSRNGGVYSQGGARSGGYIKSKNHVGITQSSYTISSNKTHRSALSSTISLRGLQALIKSREYQKKLSDLLLRGASQIKAVKSIQDKKYSSQYFQSFQKNDTAINQKSKDQNLQNLQKLQEYSCKSLQKPVIIQKKQQKFIQQKRNNLSSRNAYSDYEGSKNKKLQNCNLRQSRFSKYSYSPFDRQHNPRNIFESSSQNKGKNFEKIQKSVKSSIEKLNQQISNFKNFKQNNDNKFQSLKFLKPSSQSTVKKSWQKSIHSKSRDFQNFEIKKNKKSSLRWNISQPKLQKTTNKRGESRGSSNLSAMSRFPNIRLSYFQDIIKIKQFEQNSHFQKNKLTQDEQSIGNKKQSIQSEQQAKKYQISSIKQMKTSDKSKKSVRSLSNKNNKINSEPQIVRQVSCQNIKKKLLNQSCISQEKEHNNSIKAELAVNYSSNKTQKSSDNLNQKNIMVNYQQSINIEQDLNQDIQSNKNSSCKMKDGSNRKECDNDFQKQPISRYVNNIMPQISEKMPDYSQQEESIRTPKEQIQSMQRQFQQQQQMTQSPKQNNEQLENMQDLDNGKHLSSYQNLNNCTNINIDANFSQQQENEENDMASQYDEEQIHDSFIQRLQQQQDRNQQYLNLMSSITNVQNQLSENQFNFDQQNILQQQQNDFFTVDFYPNWREQRNSNANSDLIMQQSPSKDFLYQSQNFQENQIFQNESQLKQQNQSSQKVSQQKKKLNTSDKENQTAHHSKKKVKNKSSSKVSQQKCRTNSNLQKQNNFNQQTSQKRKKSKVNQQNKKPQSISKNENVDIPEFQISLNFSQNNQVSLQNQAKKLSTQSDLFSKNKQLSKRNLINAQCEMIQGFDENKNSQPPQKQKQFKTQSKKQKKMSNILNSEYEQKVKQQKDINDIKLVNCKNIAIATPSNITTISAQYQDKDIISNLCSDLIDYRTDLFEINRFSQFNNADNQLFPNNHHYVRQSHPILQQQLLFNQQPNQFQTTHQNDLTAFQYIQNTQKNSLSYNLPSNFSSGINSQKQLNIQSQESFVNQQKEQNNSKLLDLTFLSLSNQCLPQIDQIKQILLKVMKELSFKKIESQFMLSDMNFKDSSNSLKKAGRSLVNSLQVFLNLYQTQCKFSKFQQIQIYLKHNRKQIKEFFDNENNLSNQIDFLVNKIKDASSQNINGLKFCFDQLKQQIFGKHLNELKQKYQTKDKYKINEYESLICEQLTQCPYVRKQELKIFYNFGYFTMILIACASLQITEFQINQEANTNDILWQDNCQYQTIDIIQNVKSKTRNSQKDLNDIQDNFCQDLIIDQSTKNQPSLKLTERSLSSGNSQYVSQNDQQIQEDQQLNLEIDLPLLNPSDINCQFQQYQNDEYQYTIPQQYHAQNIQDFGNNEMSFQQQEQQEWENEYNYQCEERQIVLNEQEEIKIPEQNIEQSNREEPFIKDDNREFGCVVYSNQRCKNQINLQDEVIKQQFKQININYDKSIENISQQSSHSSYLQNPDQLTESVRNISQIVENTNNFMHILDFYTYNYITNGHQMYNTQNILDNYNTIKVSNLNEQQYDDYLKDGSCVQTDPNNIKQIEQYFETIQTFTDDFVDEKNTNKSENRALQIPQKSQKKEVGIRVDELLNKFKQESNFDTMSKIKCQKKKYILNNECSILDYQSLPNEKELKQEIIKLEFEKNQKLSQICDVNYEEIKNEIEDEQQQQWTQQKMFDQQTPQLDQFYLQNNRIENEVHQNFEQKIEQLPVSDRNQNNNFEIQIQKDEIQMIIDQPQIDIQSQNNVQNNSARIKKKTPAQSNKITPQQQKNMQQKQINNKKQFQKNQSSYLSVIAQSLKKDFKQYETLKKQRSKVQKQNEVTKQKKDVEQIKNWKTIPQNVVQNLNNFDMFQQNQIFEDKNEIIEEVIDQKDNIADEKLNDDFEQIELQLNYQQQEKTQYNENQEFINNENLVMSSQNQDSQRNKILSMISAGSRQPEIFNLPLQIIHTSVSKEKGESTQISSERKYIEEQNFYYQNLQSQYYAHSKDQQYYDLVNNQQIQNCIPQQKQNNNDINYQEINFQNEQYSQHNQSIQYNYEDRIKRLEDQNKELQEFINRSKIEMIKANPIQIQIETNDLKKLQEVIVTQPITATNVLLSDETKKKFCFDYEETNKQDQQYNNQTSLQQQLNLLSSQRLSYDVGCFEGSSSNMNTQNFRTPRVIQMLSERSAEGYLPDFINEGLFNNLINDQSPLQINYSNSSFQQNTMNLEQLKKQAQLNEYKQNFNQQQLSINKQDKKKKNEKVNSVEKNKILNDKQKKSRQQINSKNSKNSQRDKNQKQIEIQKKNKSEKENSMRNINEEMIQKKLDKISIKKDQNDCKISQNSSNREKQSKQMDSKRTSQRNSIIQLEEKIQKEGSQKNLNQNVNEDFLESVEINKILENIENLKKARANSGDRRSSKELKILTDQVIEKSLLSIQRQNPFD